MTLPTCKSGSSPFCAHRHKPCATSHNWCARCLTRVRFNAILLLCYCPLGIPIPRSTNTSLELRLPAPSLFLLPKVKYMFFLAACFCCPCRFYLELFPCRHTQTTPAARRAAQNLLSQLNVHMSYVSNASATLGPIVSAIDMGTQPGAVCVEMCLFITLSFL